MANKQNPESFPTNVIPMTATLIEKPFNDSNWFFEIKFDGYRCIAEVRNGIVHLHSRNLNSFDVLFAPIRAAFQNYGHDVIFDGEVIVMDDDGKSNFQALQNYRRHQRAKGQLCYYVFDVLFLDGRDLRREPLWFRKKQLRKVLPSSHVIRFSDHVETTGEALFLEATKMGIEGVIAKDKYSPYQSGRRSRDWLKIKTTDRQHATIIGYSDPGGSRQHFGSLIVADKKNHRLQYIGRVGTGFSEDDLFEIKNLLAPLEIDRPAASDVPVTDLGKVHWVKPVVECEIVFQNRTESGGLRAPRFVGLRTDTLPLH